MKIERIVLQFVIAIVYEPHMHDDEGISGTRLLDVVAWKCPSRGDRTGEMANRDRLSHLYCRPRPTRIWILTVMFANFRALDSM